MNTKQKIPNFPRRKRKAPKKTNKDFEPCVVVVGISKSKKLHKQANIGEQVGLMLNDKNGMAKKGMVLFKVG